jgi:hypothetical protein
MPNKKLSIRQIVTYLNDVESESGGFWLPNIGSIAESVGRIE